MYEFLKAFTISTILSAVLAFGSCTCAPGANQLPEHITLLLCTANVQFFAQAQPSAILQALDALRQEQDDLVLFGLQETHIKNLNKIKQILPAYQVYDYRKDTNQLSNAVLVYNKFQLTIKYSGINLPAYTHTPDRYATVLDFPAIHFKLVNTHLVGGRFDDQHWYKHPHARNEQIRAILKAYPTVILGDFNADNTPAATIKQGGYWETMLKLGVRQGKDPVQVEVDFRNYMFGLHGELVQQGYTSLLKKQDINYTVKRGASQCVVDWMYARKYFVQSKDYQVLDQGVIRAIDQGLSDHDFPWIRIRMKVPPQ